MTIHAISPHAIAVPHPAAAADAFARWQAHLDSGLIGANPPTPPAVAAQRDALARQFAAYAADARRLARECRA